jgi:5'-phosphate synthase pdxT subunit
MTLHIPKIGVLALQGGFVEHISMLKKAGADPCKVTLPDHLEGLSGLIIPGGESTTIGKLAVWFGLMEPLRAFAAEKAVWGTCAGMIFLARETDREQPILGVMDITVQRNAFGRQVDSFETGLVIETLRDTKVNPYPGIFIRAPKISRVGPGVQVIAALNDRTPVAAIQGRKLVTAFHPELTQDIRFHEYFLRLASNESG